jgi:hypothetical protein
MPTADSYNRPDRTALVGNESKALIVATPGGIGISHGEDLRNTERTSDYGVLVVEDGGKKKQV